MKLLFNNLVVLLLSFALLSAHFTLAADAICPKYLCNPADSKITMRADQCVLKSGNDFYLQTCTKTPEESGLTYCNLDSGSDTEKLCTNPVTPEVKAWPGEKCGSGFTCFFGTCDHKTNLCVGYGEGVTCGVDDQCNPGLFCNNNSCIKLRTQGQECTKDTDCEVKLGCKKITNFLGECVPYFSVENGKEIHNCVDNMDFLCQTGSCISYSPSGTGICVDPIKSAKHAPYTCLSDIDCIGHSGDSVFQSKCICGKNPQGLRYCTPFLNDNVGKIYIYALKKQIASGASVLCNTTRRFSNNCILSSGYRYAKHVVSSRILFQNYPLLQGNDDCVKAIYNQFYWVYGQAGRAMLAGMMVLLAIQGCLKH